VGSFFIIIIFYYSYSYYMERCSGTPGRLYASCARRFKRCYCDTLGAVAAQLSTTTLHSIKDQQSMFDLMRCCCCNFRVTIFQQLDQSRDSVASLRGSPKSSPRRGVDYSRNRSVARERAPTEKEALTWAASSTPDERVSDFTILKKSYI
jgi:hypothetical protein